jgi:formamidopyrimidine-DNA glycosylase
LSGKQLLLNWNIIMPELPEVETIRRGLDKQVRGSVISDILLDHHRGFQFSKAAFRRAVQGESIRRLNRRGKYLVFELDHFFCVFHLGMTGQLTIRDPSREDVPFRRHPVTGLQRTSQHSADKHTHLQFVLDNGHRILFRDVRKFGKVALLDRKKRTLEDFFSRLGLEPFTSDYNLGDFLSYMNGRKTKVKSLLLDQGFVAGVGNIYADEALFEARIHPSRSVRQLRVYEKQALFQAIPLVLEKGIRFGGTTIRDFINTDGEAGEHEQQLNVYGRQGQPCRSCDTRLEKIVVSQRGTHFCPACQPLKGWRRKLALVKGSRL